MLVVVLNGNIVLVSEAIYNGTLNVLYAVIVCTFTADFYVANILSMDVISNVAKFCIRLSFISIGLVFGIVVDISFNGLGVYVIPPSSFIILFSAPYID
jgi:hypothetical protein